MGQNPRRRTLAERLGIDLAWTASAEPATSRPVGAAFLFVHRPGGLTPTDHAQFDAAAARIPARVRALGRDDERGRDARFALWSREGGRFQGLSRNDRSWLAVVGNPTHGGLAKLGPAPARARLLELADAGRLDTVSPP